VTSSGTMQPLVLRRTADGAVVCLRVSVAQGFLARLRGLMGRAALASDEGLYLGDSSIHMMFMRFPIDACFVSDPDGEGRRRVVAVRHSLPPWRGIVLPVAGARGVIELSAGTLRRHGVAPGDILALGDAEAAPRVPDAPRDGHTSPREEGMQAA
jgi:uncharacterized protein